MGRGISRPFLILILAFDGSDIPRRISRGWYGRRGKHFADDIIPMLLCETPPISCGDMLSLEAATRYELHAS
jgi:hypothetical protein